MQSATQQDATEPGAYQEAPDPLLRYFLDGRTRTRRSVIAATGMARSTVNPRLEALVRTGLLLELDGVVSTGGRPPVLLQLNAAHASVAVVEIEDGCLRVAVTDLVQRVLVETEDFGPLDPDPEQTFLKIEQMLLEVMRRDDLPPVVAVGASVGMPVDPRTKRPIHPPQKPRWHDYDVAARLHQVTNLRVHVDGMNNLFALGELAFDDQDEANMLYVHASTRIGAGVVIDGRVVRGATGQIGHIGHVRGHWDEDDRCDACGRYGCLEAIASGGTLVRRFGHRLPAQTIAAVVEAARDGDQEILSTIREYGRKLGSVVAGYMCVLNPRSIVIGGDLMDAGLEYFTGVREGINASAYPMSTADLLVRPARDGHRASIIGGARLAAHYYLAPDSSLS